MDRVLPSGEVQKITVVTSRHTAVVHLKPGAMFYGRKVKERSNALSFACSLDGLLCFLSLGHFGHLSDIACKLSVIL